MLEQQGTTQLDGVRKKVFDDRYALRDEDGRQLEQGPEDMWARVARAIASAEATPALQREWEGRFYDLLAGFKFVPGGRILSGAGTGHEVTFYNCVRGDTLVHTREGLVPIATLCGQVDVLSQDGVYRPATFGCYGWQRLYEVVLENGTMIYATREHEWIVSGGQRVQTHALGGQRIPLNPRPKPPLDEDFRRGLQHGILYGDGSVSAKGYHTAHVPLFGDKQPLAQHFVGDYAVRHVPATAAVAEYTRVTGMPAPLKAGLPGPEASPSYWRGFVAGLIATDGCVSTMGRVTIYNRDADVLYAISQGMALAGFIPTGITMSREYSPYTGERKPVYCLALARCGIAVDDLVKPRHRANWEAAPPPRPGRMRVSSVRRTEQIEPVFCCVEPETHTMTVGHGYLTGQCFVVAVGESPYRCDGHGKPELTTQDARPAFFRALSEMTDIMARSGGVGMNLSALPPKGTSIPAPRRGLLARPRLTVALSVAHPDVLTLLAEKDSPLLAHLDLAVILTRDFRDAVAADASWTFHWTSSEPDGPAPVEGPTLPARAVLRRLEHPGGRLVHLVSPDERGMPVPDSRAGIVSAALAAAQARYQGESFTADFSFLRPQGAYIKTVNGTSSGPVSWMYLFDATSRLDDGWHATEKGVIHFAEIASTITGKTIQQGGTRRGALMIMLNDDHPDIYDFITAKRINPETGRPVMIEHANMSVCVSDAFMSAVEKDLPWDLHWGGVTVRTVRARDIWNKICEAAHSTAEPGVVFMQRCQEEANTWYYERINCVNPCGEQPLPPGGVCNLGAINLAEYVDAAGELAEEKLSHDTAVAIRFLDNVIDVTPYFTDLNRQMQKEGTRRTGLGIMGLADMLIKMGLRYGSQDSLAAIERACRTMRDAAYRASVALAEEKGPFPRYSATHYLDGPFIRRLPWDIRSGIAQHGVRNGVLLTVAPTGTTSLLAGVSSGIEPVFSFVTKRRDRLGEHTLYHPLAQAWREAHPGARLPDYFVGAMELTPEDHVRTQAAVQRYVDASISKTCNAPHGHSTEDVDRLYRLAYELGCKGVTYYRDGSRDAVLTAVQEPTQEPTQDTPPALSPTCLLADAQPREDWRASWEAQAEKYAQHKAVLDAAVDEARGERELPPPIPAHCLKTRPEEVAGYTSSLSAPEGSVHLTINHDADGPIEVFVNVGRAGSDLAAIAEALGRLCSLVLRLPSSMTPQQRLAEMANQLRGIGGGRPVGFGPQRVLSLPDALSQLMEGYLERHGAAQAPAVSLVVPAAAPPEGVALLQAVVAEGRPRSAGNGNGRYTGNLCPQCGSATLVRAEGCRHCEACGHSEC